MIFKVVPFRRDNQDFDAVIAVQDKYLGDTVDSMFERMRSDKSPYSNLSFGPFTINIKPRNKR